MSGKKPISREEEVSAGDEAEEELEKEEQGERTLEETLEEALEEARAQAQDNYDRFLRVAAELDNYRKRTARVRMEAREEVLRDVLLQIAPVLDNLSRALAQENQDIESLRQGIELIHSQFKDVLGGYGLEEIQAVGLPFDPNLHEALVLVESPEHPPGTVVEEMEKGYTLNKKVVRPSRVIVSKAGE